MRDIMMASTVAIVLAFCAFLINEADAVSATAALTDRHVLASELHNLQRHFDRSEEEHAKSMKAIMEKMSSSSALEVLRRNKKADAELLSLAQTAVAHKHLRSFAVSNQSVAGLQSIGNAKKLLNSLLEESMKKYDVEILKCRDYYTKQCGMIEEARGSIAASNFKVAACRTHILSAEGQISLGETSIPPTKQALTEHRHKCKQDVVLLHKRLKTVQHDLEVMNKILDMTDCGASFIQTKHRVGKHVHLLHCEQKCECTERQKTASLLSFDHTPLRHHIDSLKSKVAHQLLQESFSDLAETAAHEARNATPADKLRRTVVPPCPCTNPNKLAPSPMDKRAAKCTLAGVATCTTLQERFTLIQSSLKDNEDNMKDEVVDRENECEKTEETLSHAVEKAEQTLKQYQTKLAEGTGCENEAAEEGRLSNKEFQELTEEMHKMKASCSANYQNFESEMCGLKKIRSELVMKMKGMPGRPPFIQDCKLSDWTPGECTKSCGGGEQQMTRSVDTQPKGGAACLPLTEARRCNEQPCPVDCQLSPWSGWSSCSAECGGGVQERLRDVERNMKHNGNPCGEISETKPCNVQACEADCDLHDWSHWGKCSKACDSGTRKRIRRIKTAATGDGECPSTNAPERAQFMKCNAKPCVKPKDKPTIACESKLDLILVLDGSGSLGKKGWKATQTAAELLIGSLNKTKAQVAVLLYSGPKTWKDVNKCFKKPGINQEAVCKMKWVTHFTSDTAQAAKMVKFLSWPRGSTMTSLALQNALAETQLGRQDAKTVVAVITDGKPMSSRATYRAAMAVRKTARLMWIPVTKFAPLKMIRRMATRRWQENVVLANTFDTLKSPKFVDHIIADMCPAVQ